MTKRTTSDAVVPAAPALLLVFAAVAALIAACAAPGSAPVAEPPAPGNAPAEVAVAGDPTAIVIKSPTCSCCGGHEEYMREAGLEVTSVTQVDMNSVKDRYGVPTAMRSCHTTDVAGYFVEGHVPMAAIDRLMAERPDLDGIALPGMPPGSPGMGGVQDGPFVVFGIRDGEVVGEFGSF
jgi:hypothetical protein